MHAYNGWAVGCTSFMRRLMKEVRMARDQRVLSALTKVERWFLSDVASGLTKEMPETAPVE